jgi:hypothetical protein
MTPHGRMMFTAVSKQQVVVLSEQTFVLQSNRGGMQEEAASSCFRVYLCAICFLYLSRCNFETFKHHTFLEDRVLIDDSNIAVRY